jgi:glutamate/tyrosine decarboxylase-like PLP-dependent enzyme
LVESTPGIELVAPVDLNIVCFLFNPGDREEAALNAVNQEILLRLHESGVAAPSYTTLHGRYAIRAAITNHRSQREDFDILVREVMRIAAEVV